MPWISCARHPAWNWPPGRESWVTEAVEAVKSRAIKKPVAFGVIANPHSETMRLIELSAGRFMGKQTQEHSLDEQTIQEV